MANPIPFLIIDDNESIIFTLKKVIGTVYPQSPVFTTEDGLEAWDLLQRNQNPMILICEDNISGINGIQLFKKIQTLKNPDKFFFFILSSNIEKDYIIKILQSGVDDIIKKPLAIEDIVAKLRIAMRVINQESNIESKETTINQLTYQLSRDTENLRELLVYLLELKIPDYASQIKSISEKALWISSELVESGAEDVQEIEKAAQLCLTGKLSLPDNLLKSPVLIDGQPLNEIMANFPENTKQILSKIRDYEGVSNIICHIYENFDGSGIPDRIKGWQIPLCSRILRVVLDFEYFTNVKGLHAHKVIEMLEHESQRLYDFRIITLLDQFDAAKGLGSQRERPVKIKEIKEGMIITRDIVISSGIKILGRGLRMEQDKIDKLIQITSSDPVVGSVYIKV